MTQCEYFLVEYVPSAVQEWRVPIGVILLEESGRLVRWGFTRNWRTIRCLDPGADRILLETLPAYFEEMVREAAAGSRQAGASLRRRLLTMAENDSGTVQVSFPRGVESADPAQEFERLFTEHVERRPPVSPQKEPRTGGRRWLQARVRDALERHKLWDRFHKNIPVEEFTAPGDAFRIDFAYRPNGVTNYLHALSLEHDWNQAKVLSYTFWRIRQRIPATLTAIVADAEPAQPGAQSCRQILAESQIALQPLAGLDAFLDEVRSAIQRGGAS